MQPCVLVIGFLLTSQLGDSLGGRYADMQASSPPESTAVTTGQQTTANPPAQRKVSAEQAFNNYPQRTYPQRSPQRTTIPPSASPATPTAGLAKVMKPAELLQQLVKRTNAQELIGSELSLAEAVQGCSSRSQQTQRVKLYWELSQAVTEHRLASREVVELSAIESGFATQPNLAWQQSRQIAEARREVTRNAVRLAQLRLQKELGHVGTQTLPFPTDLPHCGAYETRFKKLFQTRRSDEAERLSQLLPMRHQELTQQVQQTVAAHEWYKLESQQRRPQSDGSRLLKAYESLALQRRAFVSTAYQYNANIARYTELAVPQQVNTARLVAMLIQSDSTSPASWQRSGVRQATAEQALPRQTSPPGRPRTFVEGSRSRSLRLSGDEANSASGNERSIIVSPQGL